MHVMHMHMHSPPSDLSRTQDTHVGYAMDGYPIYGPLPLAGRL